MKELSKVDKNSKSSLSVFVKVLLILGGLFVGLSLAWLFHFRLPQKTYERPQEKYVTSNSQFKFDKVVQKLDNLNYGSYTSSGESIDQIIKKFGKATYASSDYSKDTPKDKPRHTLQLYYGGNKKEDFDSQIIFVFNQIKGKYRLVSGSVLALDYEATKAESLSRVDFDQLKRGDKKTGQGGISYEEVEKKFGFPNSVHYLLDYSTENIEKTVHYQTKNEYVELVFVKQEDGQFLLREGQD